MWVCSAHYLRRCFLLWVGEPVLTPRPERDEPEFRVFDLRKSAFREPELREPERYPSELRLLEFRERELRPFESRPFPAPRSGGTRHSGP